jgi:glycosyltransferase involved in cell wall biosynthesis
VIRRRSLVSVIVPAYNARAYLADALGSIRLQDYHPLETIVVDDGSTDGSGDIARDFGGEVICVRQHNQGAAAARNHGLRLARGNMIAFLDADDLWPPGTLKLLTTYLADHHETEAAIGRVQYMRWAKSVNGQCLFEPFADPCLALNLGAGLYGRSVFDKVGIFDQALRISDDIDWFMRVRERAIALTFLEQVTLLYRRHDQNMTLARDATHAEFARALKKSLDRRRQTGEAESLGKLIPTAQAPKETYSAQAGTHE